MGGNELEDLYSTVGGNVLDLHTKRLEDDDFQKTKRKVEKHIKSFFPAAELHFVRSYREKEDHGDMDVVIQKNTVDRSMLVNSFNPSEVHRNGDVVSLDYMSVESNPFQMDLIFRSEDVFGMSCVYLAWNDLGNLMGKIARWRRFTYGFQGLRYKKYVDSEKTDQLGDYVLSRNPEKIFPFLGFDWDRFQEGFETLEDVFEYVVGSEYFCHDAFEPDNLRADQRHRDHKRSTYNSFMEYLEEVPDVRKDRLSYEKAESLAKDYFPEANLEKRIERDRKYMKRREEATDVLNGNVLMDVFDIQGRELGKAIGRYKSFFEDDEEYHKHLLEVGRQKAINEFAEVNGLEKQYDDDE